MVSVLHIVEVRHTLLTYLEKTVHTVNTAVRTDLDFTGRHAPSLSLSYTDTAAHVLDAGSQPELD